MTLFNLVTIHTKENILSEATVNKYHSVVKLFVGNTGINHIDIQHNDILAWRDAILDRSSAGNWNNCHRHMRAILQTAVDLKHLDENPFKKVKAVTHYPSKIHILSIEQINHLLKLCDTIEHGWFWRSVIQTLRYTGIRRRQLVSLTWHDFDLENKTLKMQAGSSKTKCAYTIPINQAVIDSILLIKRRINDIYPKKHNQIFNITQIKPRYKSDKMNEEHLARFFVEISKITNFAVSAHRFRHTFATRLANNGITNIKTVQNLLGHSSVHTTLGYVHPSMSDMRQAVGLL